MKIRKIKYNNHPILENLEIDLVNPNTGQPYDTILFAGENGTGKTTILSSLNSFLCLDSFEHFERIEYEVDGHSYAVVSTGADHDNKRGFHNRIDLQTNAVTSIRRNRNNDVEGIVRDCNDIRHCGCVYSKARADFSVKTIKGTTSLEIDKNQYDQDNQEDFSSLKQLIVDLQTEDSEDLQEQFEATLNQGFDYAAFKLTTKMYRFSSAFDNFFEKIKYKKVVTKDGEKNILFSKHNTDITIDQLSTGEKQIVYRGIYLLRNVGKLDGATIMIDEPELSMHPLWQKRILQYFKDLFKAADGTQKVQLFFATHSEYVLGEGLKDQANTLVIVLKDNNGTIEKHEVRTPLVLPTITASEINYAAFNIPSVDYHIALYGAIQSKYNVNSVVACDRKIESCAPYYNAAQHEVITTSPTGTTYKTVCTKVRNHIDHPDTAPSYIEEEMIKSIKLMRDILMHIPVW